MNAMLPTRRQVLAGGGLLIGLMLPGRGAMGKVAATAPFRPNAFVRVGTDNLVTVIAKHIEFGQGPATGVATVIADELDADWGQIRVEFAPANDPLYKNNMFGTMGTGGSSAMKESWMQMRNAGASARAMLVEAAARRWGVPAGAISVSKGVVSAGARQATFGELAADAATLPMPEKPVLKTPDKFTLIGKPGHKIDSRMKTDGSAIFTMDVQRPGMVHSAIRRPPAFGGTPGKVVDAGARAIPGVIDVQPIATGVVVYAKDTWSAQRGVAALEVDWDLSKAETRSSEQMFASYAETARTPGRQAELSGDPAAALSGATRKIDATYYFPFLAHAPMETMDCVIEKNADGGVDAYMGAQFQVGDMRAICAVAGVPFEKSNLKQQYAGGSFGRRATPTMADSVEAASAAKAFGFKAPIKHVASREADITGGHYRPLTVHRVQAGLDAAGDIAAWDQVIVAQSFVAGTPMEQMGLRNGIDAALVEGAAHGDYGFAHHRVGQHIVPNGVPTLWWRSVGHTHTAFVKETLVDELLTMGGKDLVEGRLALLKEERAKGVLRRVAAMSSFGAAPAKGRAKGIAVHKSFDSYVAQVAEISVGADGLPKVHKVWCAVDCGLAINPDVVRAQMEGGIGFGLGHALYAEISLGEGGKVQQSNFDTYRSLRIGEMPEVDVAIIDSAEPPTGVGEPGVPPIAPAVANAWRKLTGKTVRRLPFAHGDNA
ncbi:MAG: xanthine dehydrogenase family protein molybdopterin-binding subunit [Sphingobium sp.]